MLAARCFLSLSEFGRLEIFLQATGNIVEEPSPPLRRFTNKSDHTRFLLFFRAEAFDFRVFGDRFFQVLNNEDSYLLIGKFCVEVSQRNWSRTILLCGWDEYRHYIMIL